MAIVRKFLALLLLLLLVIAGVVFAAANPDPISIDIGLARFDSVPMPLAFGAALAVGWLLGLASAGPALLRLAGQKRRLRRDLTMAETELRAGRASAALRNAD